MPGVVRLTSIDGPAAAHRASGSAGAAGPAGPHDSAGSDGAAVSGDSLGSVGEIRVANTGAPLDAGGVAALASLRASAKRDDPGSAGRFGVGFAAVLAVSDEPRLVVGPGAGVRFSAADTAAAVRELPGPAAEVARREGQVPVLRLVWPVAADEPGPPEGFATEVRLPLRPGVDVAALVAQARMAGPDLLLGLSGLAAIEIDGERIERTDVGGMTTVGGARYRVVRASVTTEAGAAVEDRHRRERALCWALPLDGEGTPASLGPSSGEVLHAPTAGAERLGLPARLIADLPLDPDRRRVRPGPVLDAVVSAAAAAYVDLVLAVPVESRLDLVPATGFPLSELDGWLRGAIIEALALAPWLPPALPPSAGVPTVAPRGTGQDRGGSDPRGPGLREQAVDGPGPGGPGDAGLAEPGVGPAGSAPASELLSPFDGAAARASAVSAPPVESAGGPTLLVPRRAEWLDLAGAPGLPALLAAADPAFARLADVDPRRAAVLGELGMTRVGAVEMVERLFGIEAGPRWWRTLYAALEPALESGPGLAEELRALPVPLVDGRLAAGPPSVLVGELDDAAREVAALGLPGLHVADPEAVHPLLARLSAGEADHATLLDHPALREAVDRSLDDADAGLDTTPLAEAVLGLLPGTPGFGALALPDDEGLPSRADELMLPDAAIRPLLDPEAPIGILDAGWAGRFPREALVAAGVLDGFAVVVDEEPAGPEHALHDEDLWWDSGPEPTRVAGVRDLDLVDDDAWPAALALLASEPETRAAILDPGGYTGWWLSRNALLGGEEPAHWRRPEATHLAGLYDPAPVGPADPGTVASATAAPDPAALPPARSDLAGSDLTDSDPTGSGPTGAEPGPDSRGATPRLAGPGRRERVFRPTQSADSRGVGVDSAVLAAIGVRGALRVGSTGEAADLLGRLGDPGREVSAALAAEAHEVLAGAVAAGVVDVGELAVPALVRSLAGTVVDVDRAVVLDVAWALAVLPAAEIVVGGEPGALAAILDLPLASEVVAGEVVGEGEPVAWAALPEVVVACRTAGLPLPFGEVWLHELLEVDLTRPEKARTAVPTWVDAAGRVHADDPVRALLAHRPGRDTNG
ncbi:hypothetical protein GCM10009836_55640 [Pseudonocardia ailaonensis]|uniref:Molecular chaperone Hsp90 n=1 Tax=Pseudonocardia ailaonensis TaxID=367279 RepID=A0ABN2NID7_9PSEU